MKRKKKLQRPKRKHRVRRNGCQGVRELPATPKIETRSLACKYSSETKKITPNEKQGKLKTKKASRFRHLIFYIFSANAMCCDCVILSAYDVAAAFADWFVTYLLFV